MRDAARKKAGDLMTSPVASLLATENVATQGSKARSSGSM